MRLPEENSLADAAENNAAKQNKERQCIGRFGLDIEMDFSCQLY